MGGLRFIAEGVTPVNSFDDMDLSRDLLRGIYAKSWERPSAIQQRAIVPVTQGGDVVAQAPSGQGKTGAFTIGVLQRVDPTKAACQVLMISPTRPLAQQTFEVVTEIGRFMVQNNKDNGVKSAGAMFIGGTEIRDDLRHAQANNFYCAVGTPGRLLDLIERGTLRMEDLKSIVLDEADDLLSSGFQDQIHDIFKYIPRDIQVCLFSATLPEEVLELSRRFMRNPTQILVKREQLTLSGIKQFYVAVSEERKSATLADLYKHATVAQSVVFCSSRRRVDWLGEKMQQLGHTVSTLHTELDKEVAQQVLKNFKAGHTRVLITTDWLARGYDVHHVSMVINFDLPRDRENYLHRIGRAGRYGRKGLAINLVSENEVQELEDLEKHYSTSITQLPVDFSKYLDSTPG